MEKQLSKKEALGALEKTVTEMVIVDVVEAAGKKGIDTEFLKDLVNLFWRFGEEVHPNYLATRELIKQGRVVCYYDEKREFIIAPVED